MGVLSIRAPYYLGSTSGPLIFGSSHVGISMKTLRPIKVLEARPQEISEYLGLEVDLPEAAGSPTSELLSIFP